MTTDSRTTTTRKCLFRTIGALAILLIAVECAATTLTWQFTTRAYSDFSNSLPPLAVGTLITSSTLNERGHYQIIEAVGTIGNQGILGLSVNPNYHGYAPDNAISLNLTDIASNNGCRGWSYFPVAASTFPHVSCAGLAFSTAAGPVNLSFGGATEVMTESYAQSFVIVRTQFAQVVPEPSAFILMVTGLIPVALRLVRRKPQNALARAGGAA